uniref:Uncharacterized protein n=1 Tax=Octopus bimaculoides TaxID=37653 RepID=A0A0L8G245_OCTBM
MMNKDLCMWQTYSSNTINSFQHLEGSVKIVDSYCLQHKLISSGGEYSKNIVTRTKTRSYCLC